MNYLIVELINTLSLLPKPLSFEQVTNFFTQSTAFHELKTSLDFRRNYPEIIALQQTAIQGKDKKRQLDELNSNYNTLISHQNDLCKWQHEEQQLEKKLDTIRREIKETRNKLTVTFNKFAQITLTPTAYQNLITKNAGLLDTPSELTKQQSLFVTEQKKLIQKEIDITNRPLGQKKLLQLKKQKTLLIKQLNEYLTKYNLDSYSLTIPFNEQVQIIKDKIAVNLNSINSYKVSLNKLQQEFANYISMEENEKLLQEEQVNLIQKQKDITQKINSFSLISEQIKSDISRCMHTKSLEELLTNQQQRENTLLAYLNPFMLYDLYQESDKHKEDQSVVRHTREYLELLLEQKKLNCTLQEVQNQQKELKKAAAVANINNMIQTDLQSQQALFKKTAVIDKARKVSSEERKLMDETISLVNKLPLPQSSEGFSASTSSFDDHYMKCLLTNIAFITEQENSSKTIEPLLNDLNNTLIALADVRLQYNLGESQDALLPSEEYLDSIDDKLMTTRINSLLDTQQVYVEFIKQLQLLLDQIQLHNHEEQTISTQKMECQFEIKTCDIILHARNPNILLAQKKEQETELQKLQAQIEQQKRDIQDKNDNVLINATSKAHADDLLIITQPIATGNAVTFTAPESFSIEREHTAIEEREDSELSTSASIASFTESRTIELINIAQLAVLQPPDQSNLSRSENATEPSGLFNANSVVIMAPNDTSDALLSRNTPSDVLTINTPTHQRAQTLSSLTTLSAKSSDHSSLILADPPLSLALTQMELSHQEILLALANQNEEIKSWYLAIHRQAKNSTRGSEDFYRYLHLIEDIHFELFIKKEYEVILNYQRINPKPEEDCAALLASKPHYPLHDIYSFNPKAIDALPQTLKNIYWHSKKLKTTHFIESELLFQIFLSLATFYNKEHAAKKIPLLLEDTRYDPLKRHRGLFKIWELVEDFINLIVGKIKGQMMHEYTKRPAFFKTTTTCLIEEAQIFITNSDPK